MTGTYSFTVDLYWITEMTAEFNKPFDCTLIGPDDTFRFLDDILVVSKSTFDEHMSLVKKCLEKLEEKKIVSTWANTIVPTKK